LIENDPAPEFTSSAWVAVAQPTSEPNDDTVDIDAYIGAEGLPNAVAYTVTACGPDPYSGVLLVSGLVNTSTSYFSANKGSGKSLPVRTLGTSFEDPTNVVQAVAFNFPDVRSCSSQNETTSEVVDLSAVLARPWVKGKTYLGFIDSPRVSWAFPAIGQVEGNPLVGSYPFEYEGLSGSWILPIHKQYTAEAGIPSGWSMDSSSPALADQSPPTWTADTFIAPTAQLSYPGTIAQIQDIVVVLALVFGISGSLLASLIFEYLRPPREQPEQPRNYMPSNIAAASPAPTREKSNRIKTVLTVVALLLVGYLGRSKDRRVAQVDSVNH
jgi:hypothetical protein